MNELVQRFVCTRSLIVRLLLVGVVLYSYHLCLVCVGYHTIMRVLEQYMPIILEASSINLAMNR